MGPNNLFAARKCVSAPVMHTTYKPKFGGMRGSFLKGVRCTLWQFHLELLHTGPTSLEFCTLVYKDKAKVNLVNFSFSASEISRFTISVPPLHSRPNYNQDKRF